MNPSYERRDPYLYAPLAEQWKGEEIIEHQLKIYKQDIQLPRAIVKQCSSK